MKKVVSYRQKLIELARIYKIDSVLNPNLKLTTYEIELEILKNKVPIPSRRGYFSHKIINEILNPFYAHLRESLKIDINVNKSLKKLFINLNTLLKENLLINFNLSFNLNKISKKLFNTINNYFSFVIFNTTNFFKVLSKTVVNSLNDIYYLKLSDKLLKKYALRGTYSFLLAMLLVGGFYVKEFITEVDGLKISLEIKSDKKKIVKKEEA